MKLLLDQNLSPRLTGLLADIYQECILAREKPWLFDIARPIQQPGGASTTTQVTSPPEQAGWYQVPPQSEQLKLLAELAKTDLLVLDDWGLTPLNDEQRRDLLEILDDRFNARSTLVTSQLPITHWHEYLADPTLADAILDRLVHCAYKLNLRGESLRKQAADLTHEPALA